MYKHGIFTPVFDSTDHFDFMCIECKNIARVWKVVYYPEDVYKKGVIGIFFWLVCEKCRHAGLRKIYLNTGGKDLALFYPKCVERISSENFLLLEKIGMKRVEC